MSKHSKNLEEVVEELKKQKREVSVQEISKFCMGQVVSGTDLGKRLGRVKQKDIIEFCQKRNIKY
jgi:hypothetical protein